MKSMTEECIQATVETDSDIDTWPELDLYML